MYVTDCTKLSSLREILLKKAKMKAKKKPRRRSDSSGGYTLSDIIQSPPAAGILYKHTQTKLWCNTIIKEKYYHVTHIHTSCKPHKFICLCLTSIRSLCKVFGYF